MAQKHTLIGMLREWSLNQNEIGSNHDPVHELSTGTTKHSNINESIFLGLPIAEEIHIDYPQIGNYMSWDPEEIVNWIINLDEDNYHKYKDALLRNMQNEQINGMYLTNMNRDDLFRLGVTSEKDRERIETDIQIMILDEENRAMFDY